MSTILDLFASMALLYPFYLKILDFCYRFLGPSFFKKLAIGLAITRLLKKLGPKNQIAKKPVSSGRMGITVFTMVFVVVLATSRLLISNFNE